MSQKTQKLKSVDAQSLMTIGKYHDEVNFHRFPEKYKNLVREGVWELSKNSAGISIRFSSNTSTLKLKWTLETNEKFPHMAWTGIAGLDVYTLIDNKWHFIETGRPQDKTSEYLIFENKNAVRRDYLINLPLYDGVESLYLLIDETAEVMPPITDKLLKSKPIAYYGSSITQGGCASRPGMAYTNILARRLDRPFYNLGFSGEGTFDQPVGLAMCEMDVAMYVIDCNPNSDTSFIYQRAVALVQQLKSCKPNTPILLVENYIYPDDHALPWGTMVSPNSKGELVHEKWKKLRMAYETLKKTGIKQLYYLKGTDLIGADFEGNVDDSHPTDLGMFRMAENLYPVINKILKSNKSK
ncbi:MAG: SGNH/GDSL hydrolase family protein [Saprospiraceae bacterium]|nr:SGNH/GDSL hydrolase family protein [Saprospiraceae bacterium]